MIRWRLENANTYRDNAGRLSIGFSSQRESSFMDGKEASHWLSSRPQLDPPSLITTTSLWGRAAEGSTFRLVGFGFAAIDRVQKIWLSKLMPALALLVCGHRRIVKETEDFGKSGLKALLVGNGSVFVFEATGTVGEISVARRIRGLCSTSKEVVLILHQAFPVPPANSRRRSVLGREPLFVLQESVASSS